MAGGVSGKFIGSVMDPVNPIGVEMKEYIRKVVDEFGKIKAETASIEAERKRLERILNECIQNISKMERYAKKAEESGRVVEAQKFLEQKEELIIRREQLEKDYQYVASQAQKMRELSEKLAHDMKEIDAMRRQERW